jgi:hypothetical protein
LLGVHPVFAEFVSKADVDRSGLLDQLRHFRPAETIFEFRKMGVQKNAVADQIMKTRRQDKGSIISKVKAKRAAKMSKMIESATSGVLEAADDEDIEVCQSTLRTQAHYFLGRIHGGGWKEAAV